MLTLSSGSINLDSSKGGTYDPGYLEQRVYLSQSTSSLLRTTVFAVKFVISVIYS